MSDGIVIPIDGDDTAIKGKLARIKKQSADAGKAFGNASSQAGRVGGAAGGALGRALGGFQQGGAAGALGLGLAGGGMLLNAFLQRDSERVSLAMAREARSQDRDAQARTVVDRRDQLAAGGLAYAERINRMAFRGGDQKTIRSYTSMARSYGLTSSQGLDIYDAANESQGVSPADIALGVATGTMGGAGQVAQNIKKFGSLRNAVAATQNMSQAQAGAALESFQTNAMAVAAANANIQQSSVQDAQIEALLSGETESALARSARDQLNPGARLAAEASQKTMDSVNQLRAAADAQSTVAAILAEMGRVVGMSNGSASRELTNYAAGAGVGN